ncbi:unnamed protein product [Phytophthora fragariaefolia]|uniref:Unnamed protein product n=1 Tax=Phytophthora fragariaefolia TaxID=1490495 RepID=A0A9W7CVC2_9STRA|nr:unnamed protein product [Phytophthora fragariaefolia]
MEDSESRLPARQDFPHLSDGHWATLEKMVSLLGEAAFAGFPNFPAEQQRARVERFDKYESSLIAHVSAAAQEAARAAMRAEAQSAAQASATNTASFTARSTTTKPVKMSIPTFDVKDSDSLVFWVREIEITLSAGQIYDARAQELRSTFLLVNVAYRHRSNFLRCKQGKRSLQDYVMELHNLEAAMAGAPLSEDVKVTVFMDGVRTGPVRTELFRRQPKTFNEAVHIAMLEDHCVRSAQDHTSHVEASEGPTPMELSLAESARPRSRELEVGDDEDPQDPRTPPVGRQGSAVCNRVAYVQGTVTTQGADAVTARAGKGGSVRATPTQSVAAGSAHVEECAGVVARANKSGRVGTPTTQGVVAGSARAAEGVGACARATTCGRAGAPTSKAIKGDKVTSTPKADASDHDADSAAEDRAPQVLDVFTGEPKEGEVLTPLPTVAELLVLEELSYAEFLDSLMAGELAEVVLLRSNDGSLELNSSSVMDSEVLEDERTSRRQTRYGAAILKDPSDPYHPLLKKFSDVVSDDPPSILPPDRGVRHDIDLVPGTKYCTTRQWPLPKEQVDVIDAFFAAKRAAGMVRESKSPHSSPTFCVRKPNGKWRMVHAFNKLNAAIIPVSMPIPRKDVLQNNMAGCTVFSALDMVDGYYQLLMRESDIPLTAVSTACGMLWEWLVMPHGLSNAPATFNRLVTQLFRPMRHFVQTYFDDIFVYSRASEGKTAVKAHLGHLREVLLCMRANHLYANIHKCIFGAEAIPSMGCFLGKDGVRADPEKVCAIAQWPVPVSQKDLRKWLGLANYLHKYSANYADMARPLTNLLKKDAVWSWTSEAQQAFEAITNSLQSAPILVLPDEDRPFSVVCDASDFAIGCALLQVDAEGRERVVSFQSRQLKAAEKNYPVHDKELLAMKYGLVKFRVHLLGQKPFVIYTDHASLRTATSSPHLSLRMARWLSFFAEYNFTVEYKPGKQNVLADALSRRPDYELAHLTYLASPLYELIRKAYADDDDLARVVEALGVPNKVVELTARQRSRLHRYSVVEGLLYYQVDGGDEPRIVVPNDKDLRHRVL